MTWYEKRSDRLAIEQRLIRKNFPQAKVVKKDGMIRVWLRLRGRKNLYRCELVYPKRFPLDPHIKTYVHAPRLRASPHQFTDGHLCFYHAEDVGPETTAVVHIKWLQGWIERYENYLKTGNWRN